MRWGVNKRHEYLIFFIKNGNELEGLKHSPLLDHTKIRNSLYLSSLTFKILDVNPFLLDMVGRRPWTVYETGQVSDFYAERPKYLRWSLLFEINVSQR